MCVNLVSHIEGEEQGLSVREEGAEEDIWTEEGRVNLML